jgi:hypothetical protein
MIAILASDVSALVDSTLFYSAVGRPVNHQNRNKKCPDRFCGSLEDEGAIVARRRSEKYRIVPTTDNEEADSGLRESVCIERATPNVENALSSRSTLYVYGFGTLIDANPR